MTRIEPMPGNVTLRSMDQRRLWNRWAWRAFFPWLLLLAGAGGFPLFAALLPAGFSESLVATGLSSPTAMELAPDGRIFVCQKDGQLRVIKNESLLSAPFLTVMTDSGSEKGLLGIAIDPDFLNNNFLYVYYTAKTPAAHNRVSRFQADGDAVVPGSETPILDLDDLTAGHHDGGAIHFGPDGKLYVATGENGTASNAQRLDVRLGKMLRINSDGSIPESNPFYSAASGPNRAIWAFG